jgi:hypothetical protein
VRSLYFTIDARFGRYHQRAGLLGHGGDITADHTVHAQSAAENDIALDASGGTDQAVDAVLRLALLVEHAVLPCRPLKGH